jgi:hypothetical protein
VIHYTAFIDESSTEGSKGSLVDTTYNEFKREHRHDLMGHKHRLYSLPTYFHPTAACLLLFIFHTDAAIDPASPSSSLWAEMRDIKSSFKPST